MSELKNIEAITLFKTPDESPGYLLWHVSLAWRSYIEKTLKPFDLTHPQFVVLATTAWLTRKGEHISQSDIGKAAGLDPNTTSQIVRGLESRKFIKRTRSLDERSKSPALTTVGSEVLAQALPGVEQVDAMFFAALTDQEMDFLLKLFKKIIK